MNRGFLCGYASQTQCSPENGFSWSPLPRIEADKLSGMTDCYKIKLRSAGYRPVYQIVDDKLLITVVAVGKRERSEAYTAARKRVQR